MPCGVLGEIVPVCNDARTDWSADCFQCLRGELLARFVFSECKLASSPLIRVQGTDLSD